MSSSTRFVTLAAAVLAIAACGGSPTASATPTPSAPATASAPAQPSASPVALDPCQLVTSAEASALAGTTYAAGREGTTNGGKTCVYGYQTTNVFLVLVAQAPDAATAQAQWGTELAQAQAELKKGVPAGINLNFNATDVSNVTGADRAAVVTFNTTISSIRIGLSGIYVLKGATFFTFSDLLEGHAPPTLSAMEAQAVTTLSRVP
jgi:hypothetical protein